MLIKDKIYQDYVESLKNKEKEKTSTLRLLLAAIKQYEIDKQTTVDDDTALSIINKQVKLRHESIELFNKAERKDLVTKETQELEIISNYLPPQLQEVEILQLVAEAMQTTGAQSMRDMGRIMTALKPKLVGRCNMQKVSALIKSKLN